MILFLFLINTYGTSQVIITDINPSMVKFQVRFAQNNQTELLPVTRFILSKTPPEIEYKILETDSVKTITQHNLNITEPVRNGTGISTKNATIYPVTIYPQYLNKFNKIYLKSIEITAHFTPINPQTELPTLWKRVFKELILNYEEETGLKPGGYLIITPDAFYDSVLALAEWKEKKGWHVTVKKLSETGSSATEIKNYIADAYHTWTPTLEYVLLIGDTQQIPPYSSTTPVSRTDYPYSLIDGNDFFAELLIGRLPANTVNELNTMAAKIIGYEKTPDMSSTSWFTRALMVAANYPLDTMTTPIPTKRWVREKLLEYGFNTVDTVFYPPVSSPTPITNSINQGVLFVNYRGGIADPDGWVYPNFHNTEVIGLSNGWKLPVVTSITCWNGNFGQATCFGEQWLRAGNPITPKGAVAFFGASATTTSSRWNNCLDFGIYQAILKEDIYDLGSALYRGKVEVFLNFPLDTTWAHGSSFYFHTYNLLGDPSLELWTDIPDSFIVSHSSVIPVGTNSFVVQVMNSSSQKIKGAQVSLYKKNEVKEVEFTDADGNAAFSFSTATQDTLFITVTKHNFKPYCGLCLVNNTGVYVGYESHTISDPGGNNNGEINPGETIELQVTLKNFGNSTTANNVSATLSTSDPYVTISDSIKSFGDIGPGNTGTASPYIFDVSTNTRNDHIIKFNLAVTSSQGNWNSVLWLDVKAPEFDYQRHQILDGGNGILEPGETAELSVSIKNCGALIGGNITGILRSDNPGVTVLDSLGTYGNIAAGDSATNSSDRFQISAASSIAPGHIIKFFEILSGDNNFKDTIEFEVVIGVINQSEPLGPDDYGYFAYDDTDTDYPEAPSYNWVEIDPELGGPGDSLSLENDETKTLDLPFNFKFYGQWYDKVSICSNGYIALDSTWIADMYNWHIPAAGGPPLLIAPFWDDLDPTATDSSGNVCYWYDAVNHRYVVEYSHVQHIHDPTNPTPAELQTFELILYDPQYYPTLTGDGEILFQYKEITNDDQWHNYASVGIENREHTIGLEYTYADIYPDAAAPLADNRAIKFTTDPPDSFPGITEDTQSLRQLEITLSPNPFHKQINIKLNRGLSAKGMVVHIYDITGRLIKSIPVPDSYSPGSHSIFWDGTDQSGEKSGSGVYFLNFVGKDSKIIKKVIFLP